MPHPHDCHYQTKGLLQIQDEREAEIVKVKAKAFAICASIRDLTDKAKKANMLTLKPTLEALAEKQLELMELLAEQL